MKSIFTSRSYTRRHILSIATTAVVVAAGLYSQAAAADVVIGLIPKFTSDPYFVADNKGAQEAAKELGYTVEFNGPVDANVATQSDIIDKFVRRHVTAIAVSANDPDALAPRSSVRRPPASRR